MNALWLEKAENATVASYRTLDEAVLGEGEVRVRVEWSTLNYKDGLAILGRSPVIRKFPLIPGIDLAGVVESSQVAGFNAGQRVVLNGWGHGESLHGGLSTLAVVPAAHLIELPACIGTRTAMAIGTAGYTAMLCVLALEERGVRPGDGEVLVTGAGGGVGGFSIALLASRGYTVVASTGRATEESRLKALGATRVIDRDELTQPGKPLQKENWAGVVDSVGSHTLANACAQTRYGGTVAACGLAQGLDLPTTVAPFILRGVGLVGVDSVQAPTARRVQAWGRLASDLKGSVIEHMVREIDLAQAIEGAAELMAGRVAGRLLVRTV